MQDSAHVNALAQGWRADAAVLLRRGDLRGADLMTTLAEELESALRVGGEELLSLREAAVVSGYSEDHLGRLVRQGKVPNAGRTNAPRFRCSDLPRKRGSQAARPRMEKPLDRLFQDIVTSKFGV